MTSRYLHWWHGRYTIHGPYRKPTLRERLLRRLGYWWRPW